jgi:hypothetical protein
MANATVSMPNGTGIGAVLFGLAQLFVQDPQVAAISYTVYALAEIAPYLLPDYNTTTAKITNFTSNTHASGYQWLSWHLFESSTSELVPETQTVLVTESSAVSTTWYATAMANDVLALYLEQYENFKYCANKWTAATWHTYKGDWASVWVHLKSLFDAIMEICKWVGNAVVHGFQSVLSLVQTQIANVKWIISTVITSILSIVNSCYDGTTTFITKTLSSILSAVNFCYDATTTFVSGTLSNTCRARWFWRTPASMLVSILAAPCLIRFYRRCRRTILSVAVFSYLAFFGLFFMCTEDFWNIPIAIVTAIFTDLCFVYWHKRWMALRSLTALMRGLWSDVWNSAAAMFIERAGLYVCKRVTWTFTSIARAGLHALNRFCGALRATGAFTMSMCIRMVKSFWDYVVVRPIHYLWQLTLVLFEELLDMYELSELDADALWNDTEAEPAAPVVADEKPPKTGSSHKPENFSEQTKVSSVRGKRFMPSQFQRIQEEESAKGSEAKLQRTEIKPPVTPVSPAPTKRTKQPPESPSLVFEVQARIKETQRDHTEERQQKQNAHHLQLVEQKLHKRRENAEQDVKNIREIEQLNKGIVENSRKAAEAQVTKDVAAAEQTQVTPPVQSNENTVKLVPSEDTPKPVVSNTVSNANNLLLPDL